MMEVPELVPMDQYDAEKAKLISSVRWVLTKAFSDNTPQDIQKPFYQDNEGIICLKPAVVQGLISGDFYTKACNHIFPDQKDLWKGHSGVIQGLSQLGIYIIDTNESAVTQQALHQTTPFKLNAHIALIDALMMGYAHQVLTVESVMQSVRKFSSISPSSELPTDVDQSLKFWINKVCASIITTLNKQKQCLHDSDVAVPVIEDLLKDINNGCCLATVISFYCPQIMPIQDIALSSSVSIADCLYNLQLVIDFCDRHLPYGALTLTLNDLFYTYTRLRENVLAFCTELYYHLEIQPVQCVRDIHKLIQGKEDVLGRPTTHSNNTKSSTSSLLFYGKPTLPISNATKKSFQHLMSSDSTPTKSTDATSSSTNSIPPNQQPLLPRRPKQTNNKTGSAVSMLENARGKSAVHEGQGSLLANVSIDTEATIDLHESDDNPSLTLDTTTYEALLYHDNSMSNRISSHGNPIGQIQKVEPLMPVKEKQFYSVSEDLESRHVRHYETCIKPPSSLIIRGNEGNNEGAPVDDSSSDDDAYQTPSVEDVMFFASSKERLPIKSPIKCSSRHYLATGSNATATVDQQACGAPSHVVQTGFEPSIKAKRNIAFYVIPKPYEAEAIKQQTAASNVRSTVESGVQLYDSHVTEPFALNQPEAQSFTLHNHLSSRDEVRATGIAVTDGADCESDNETVEDQLEDDLHRRLLADAKRVRHQRGGIGDGEGDGGSLGDRGDTASGNHMIEDSFYLSDTHQTPVSTNVVDKHATHVTAVKDMKVATKDVGVEDDDKNLKTSVAVINKKKQAMIPTKPPTDIFHITSNAWPVTLKSSFHKSYSNEPGAAAATQSIIVKDKKTTSFSALPNLTTWEQAAQRAEEDIISLGSEWDISTGIVYGTDSMTAGNKSAEGCNMTNSSSSSRSVNACSGKEILASEMFEIRMKLEEKRKQIRNKKQNMEIEWSQQRQKMGKQAFMQVVTKNKPSSTPDQQGTPSNTVTRMENATSSELLQNEAHIIGDGLTTSDTTSACQLHNTSADGAKVSANDTQQVSVSDHHCTQDRKSVSDISRQHEAMDISATSDERSSGPVYCIKGMELSDECLRCASHERLCTTAEDRVMDGDEIGSRAHSDSQLSSDVISAANERRELNERQDFNKRTTLSAINKRTTSEQLYCIDRDVSTSDGDMMQDQFLDHNRGSSSEHVGSLRSPSMMREQIQQKIESVRQRWFSEDSTSSPAISVSASGVRDEQSFNTISSGRLSGIGHGSSVSPPHCSMTSSTDGALPECTSSLDKLNTSLTELQGEIAKLSLKHGSSHSDSGGSGNSRAETPHASSVGPQPSSIVASLPAAAPTQTTGIPQHVKPRHTDKSGVGIADSNDSNVDDVTSSAGLLSVAMSTGNSGGYFNNVYPPGGATTQLYQASEAYASAGYSSTAHHPYMMHSCVQQGGYPPQYSAPPPHHPVYGTGYNPGPYPGAPLPQWAAAAAGGHHIPTAFPSPHYSLTSMSTGGSAAHQTLHSQLLPTIAPTGARTSALYEGGDVPQPDKHQMSPHGEQKHSTGSTLSEHHTPFIANSENRHLSNNASSNESNQDALHNHHKASFTTDVPGGDVRMYHNSGSKVDPLSSCGGSAGEPDGEDNTVHQCSPYYQEDSSTHALMAPLAPVQPTAPGEGFFVSFGDEQASLFKQKPKFNSDRIRRMQDGSKPALGSCSKRHSQIDSQIEALSDHQYSTMARLAADVEANASDYDDVNGNNASCANSSIPTHMMASQLGNSDSGDCMTSSDTLPPHMPMRCALGTGMVIPNDEQPALEAKVEKKKQRILALQQKRLEDMEKKRMKIEEENKRKRIINQEKQAQQNQKKQQDKERRQAIFAQYLKRKSADTDQGEPNSAGEGDYVSHHSIVAGSASGGSPSNTGGLMRRSKAKTARPKSQPPPSGMYSNPVQIGASYEDLYKDRMDSDALDSNFVLPPFGNQTSQRPSSPGKVLRSVGDLGPDCQPSSNLHHQHGGSTGGNDIADSAHGDAATEHNPYTTKLGPKLYVKPSAKSNRHIMQNAIGHCCLAGIVNKDIKNKVLDILKNDPAKHFVILFRDHGQQYRALYSYDPEEDVIYKIQGTGPRQIMNKMIEKFFKYNSGAKRFAEVTSTKHLSVSIDAITLHNHVWQKKQARAPHLTNMVY